jgi:hypothetical protein
MGSIAIAGNLELVSQAGVASLNHQDTQPLPYTKTSQSSMLDVVHGGCPIEGGILRLRSKLGEKPDGGLGSPL